MAINEPRLYIALYTDEDIDGRLAAQLRANGYDAISTFEVGNTTIKDPVQFAFAIRERRTILTHNAQDFAPLFDELWNQGQHHYGLVISEKLNIGELVRRCLKMLESVTADEMIDNFKNLGEFK